MSEQFKVLFTDFPGTNSQRRALEQFFVETLQLQYDTYYRYLENQESLPHILSDMESVLANILIQAESLKYLFTIDEQFVQILKLGRITRKLQKEFNKKACTISQKGRIKELNNRKWLLENDNSKTSYIFLLENRDVNVYCVLKTRNEIYNYAKYKFKIRFLGLRTISRKLVKAFTIEEDEQISFLPSDKYVVGRFFEDLVDRIFMKILKGEIENLRSDVTFALDAVVRKLRKKRIIKQFFSKEKFYKFIEKLKKADRERNQKKQVKYYQFFINWLCIHKEFPKTIRQLDVAEFLGISESYVSNILRELYNTLEELEKLENPDTEYDGATLFELLVDWVLDNNFPSEI